MRIMFYAVLAIFIVSTACSSENEVQISEYRMNIIHVSRLMQPFTKRQLTSKADKRWLVSLEANEIIWFDLIGDSVEKRVEIPLYNRVIDFKVQDTSSFVLYVNREILYYKLGELVSIPIEQDASNFLIVPSYGIGFFPTQELVSFIGYHDYELSKRKKGRGTNIVGLFDLKTGKLDVVDGVFLPEQYSTYQLPAPTIYTHAIDKYLSVSFDYDESVYVINVETKKYMEYSLSPKLNYIDFKHHDLKSKNNDEIMNSSFKYVRNGKVFYCPEKSELYRLYSPIMPFKKADDKYFTTKDLPTHILKRNINSDKVYEYYLPSGVFYGHHSWSFNNDTKKLEYNKGTYDESKKLSISIYALELFDY